MNAPVSAFGGPRSLPITSVDDGRGGLDRFLTPETLAQLGHDGEWRQVLRSRTASAGTLRGLHAQLAPWSEAKCILPLAGRMFWVALDLRAGSRDFGTWQAWTLDPAGSRGLFVPRGFAHGCLSLAPETELLILADNDYAPEHGVGIAWDDPELAIPWPLEGRPPMLSDQHDAFASFASFKERHGSL